MNSSKSNFSQTFLTLSYKQCKNATLWGRWDVSIHTYHGLPWHCFLSSVIGSIEKLRKTCRAFTWIVLNTNQIIYGVRFSEDLQIIPRSINMTASSQGMPWWIYQLRMLQHPCTIASASGLTEEQDNEESPFWRVHVSWIWRLGRAAMEWLKNQSQRVNPFHQKTL